MAAIVAVEPRFAGIGPVNPDLVGQAAWYDAKPASGVGAFVVTIQVGGGTAPPAASSGTPGPTLWPRTEP